MIDPIRSLPVANWPEADRRSWTRACVPTSRLRRSRAIAPMKTNTRKSRERAYGYFLDHCLRMGVLDQSAEAGAHVTRERVDLFLSELHRVSPVTRWSYIQKIRRVVEIVSQCTLSWLREIEGDLRDMAIPRPKHHRIVDSRRLLALGLDLIRRGEESKRLTRNRRARLVRDGLMVVILSLGPIRLANLHSLRIGKQLVRIEDAWWMVFEGAETKSGRPDERPLPELLTPIIDRWVEIWRQTFLNPQDFFWPSTKGGGLAYTYVGSLITARTRQELGVAVNPHLFRDCAVYTIANLAGTEMGIASGLLQHLDPRVTAKHYNKGSMFAAGRHFQHLLELETGPRE